MITRHLRRALLSTMALGALSALALVPTAALAQVSTTQASNAGSTNVSEVVVTAQKRAEVLNTTPVSVSVISGAKLEATQATNMQDWSGYVPGLQLGADGSPGLTTLALDGIAPVGAASEVGVYLNDTPLGSSSSFQGTNGFTADLMPYDLDRIEVLRGPQGTLYGASTMGGLIKYVLTDPNLETFSGRIGGDLFGVENGSGVGGGVRGEVNAPIIKDQLALRLSAYDENTPGFIDNATTGQKGDNALQQYGGRAVLLWKPIADFSVEASAIYQRNHADNQAIVAISQATLQPIAGPLSNINTLPEPFTQTLQLYDVRLNWDLKWATLTSVSSYQNFENNTIEDLTDYLGVYLPDFGLTAEPGQADFLEHYVLEKYTQEVRLASPSGQTFEWMVGGFYTHETGTNQETFRGYEGDGTPLTAFNPLEFAFLPSTYQEYAFFGDLTWHISHWFDISGGLRWAHNDQTFSEIEGGSLLGSSPPTMPVLTIPGNSSESVLTYMVSPTVRLNKDSIVYGRIASGYQPGGPNVVLPGCVTSCPPNQFNSARLTDYQVGFKSTFLDGRASVDLSVFDIEWSKIQVSVLFVDQSAIENAGAARSQGFDFSGSLLPVKDLTLGASLAYADAVLTTPVPSITTLAGARLPYTPMWSGSLTADYSRPINENWRGFIGAGWRYVGSRYSAVEGSTANGTPQGLEARAYGVFDLQLGARTRGFTIMVFAKNLFDNRVYLSPQTYFNSLLGTPIDIKAPVLQPRTVGVSLDKSF